MARSRGSSMPSYGTSSCGGCDEFQFVFVTRRRFGCRAWRANAHNHLLGRGQLFTSGRCFPRCFPRCFRVHRRSLFLLRASSSRGIFSAIYRTLPAIAPGKGGGRERDARNRMHACGWVRALLARACMRTRAKRKRGHVCVECAHVCGGA